jgi:hypothetical protein
MHGSVESDAEWVGGKMDYGTDYYYEAVEGRTPVLARGEPIDEPDDFIAREQLRGMLEQNKRVVAERNRRKAEQRYFVGLLDWGD